MATKTTEALAPYILHRRLVRANRPAQTWDGQPIGLWQRRLRRTVAELTGFRLIDTQERCPLRVRSLWKKEHELGSIEKIVFTCEPGCDTTAFVCLPHAASGKIPWLVCLQGHSSGAHNSVGVDRDDNSVAIEVPGDRDFAFSCLRNGVAALCLEQRGFGERRELVMPTGPGPDAKTTCYEASMHALMLGRTMIGERVYDVDRALDYLWTRDDVDRKRVGVMGNSGGGTISVFAAALLKRLRFAMPSCYFCTFDASLMDIHHCCCNFVPRLLLEAEMADVLGCFAPHPLVVVAGKDDGIFPVTAVRKAFRQLKRIYTALGAGEKVKLVIGPEGHRFYAEPAWENARPLLGIQDAPAHNL